MQEDQEVTLDLREILKSFRKHLGLIIICGLVATILGSVYTFFIATPVYTASTEVISKLPDSETGNNLSQLNGTIQLTNTINGVITSQAILDEVQNNLGLNGSIKSKVQATSDANSQITKITVNDENPYMAQKIANETAHVFSQKAEEILNVTNVSVLATAEVNTTPLSPNPKTLIPLSLIVGLVVGAGFVMIIEAFNNKITTEEQLESIGFSMLGSTNYVDIEAFLEEISDNPETQGKRSQVRNKVLKKMNMDVKSRVEEPRVEE